MVFITTLPISNILVLRCSPSKITYVACGKMASVHKTYVVQTLLSWNGVVSDTRVVCIFKNLPRVHVSCPFHHCCVRATQHKTLTHKLLSWNGAVSETCLTHVSCVFLRIYHVFTCRVHFIVVMSVQHSIRRLHINSVQFLLRGSSIRHAYTH